MNSKVPSAIKWSALTNISRKLIVPITNMCLARILTPDDFGLVATINMVVSFSDVLSTGGFNKYLIQQDFKDKKSLHEYANVAFWSNFIISILLWLVIIIFQDSIAVLVGSEGHGNMLVLAGFTIPLLSISSIQNSLFIRDFDQKRTFVPRIVNALLPFVITIPIAYFTRSPWALIIGTISSNLSDAILFTIKSEWKMKLYYSFEKLKHMLSFSIWTLFECITIWLTVNIDVFIISSVLSAYYLGLYKSSITSVSQIMTVITATIIPVLFSAISKVKHDNKEFKNVFYTFQKNVALLLVPMGVGMFVFGDLVTDILLGSQWGEAKIFISLLSISQIFIILFANFSSEAYRAKGEPRVSTLVQIGYILILAPCLYFSAKHSFETLYRTSFVLKFIFVSINLAVLKYRYGFNISKMFFNIKEIFLSALIMGVFAFILKSTTDNLILNILIIACSALIYVVCLLVFPKTRNNLKSVLKKLKKGA